MKKSFVILVAVLFLLISTSVNTYGYEEKNCSIKVSKGFSEMDLSAIKSLFPQFSTLKSWVKNETSDTQVLYLMVMEQKNEKDISDMSKSEFEDFKKQCKLSLDNGKYTNINLTRDKINGYEALKITAQGNGGYFNYHFFISKNYMFLIGGAGVSESFFRTKEYRDFLSSFKIKDTLIGGIDFSTIMWIVGAVLLIILISIIKSSSKRRKREQYLQVLDGFYFTNSTSDISQGKDTKSIGNSNEIDFDSIKVPSLNNTVANSYTMDEIKTDYWNDHFQNTENNDQSQKSHDDISSISPYIYEDNVQDDWMK